MKRKYLLLPFFLIVRAARSPLWWVYQPAFKNWTANTRDVITDMVLALILVASVLFWWGFILLYFGGLILMALIYLFKKYPNGRRTENIRDEKAADPGKSRNKVS